MTDSPVSRPPLVKVRLSGRPDAVDAIVDRITAAFTVSAPPKPYPNRRDPSTVRVYLEVSPG